MKEYIVAKIKGLKESNPELFKDKIDFLLVDEEELLRTYQTSRDFIIMTTKRIIFVEVMGMTGKTQDYRSVGYSKISSFSVETVGTFDFESKVKLWVFDLGIFELEFAKNTDIKPLLRIIGRNSL
jgi:hypothetical protein